MFAMFGSLSGSTQKLPNFLSKSEKEFVRNVISIEGEEPVQITKRQDNHIVLEFTNTMFVLKPDGFVGETWVLGDEDWVRLGTEEEAY